MWITDIGKCLKICVDNSKYTFNTAHEKCQLKLPERAPRTPNSLADLDMTCQGKSKFDVLKLRCVDCPEKIGEYWSQSKERCKWISFKNCINFGRLWHRNETDPTTGFCTEECRSSENKVSMPRGRCKRVKPQVRLFTNQIPRNST